jgi:hypothetical protein
MVIWIVIYSYFDSPDFIDEATVLFGGVTFWATVVISMVIALRAFPLTFSNLAVANASFLSSAVSCQIYFYILYATRS